MYQVRGQQNILFLLDSFFPASPFSLLRLGRVSTRKVCIPHCEDNSLTDTQLPDELQQFVNSIRHDCCATDIVKKKALLGRTVGKTNTQGPSMEASTRL